MKTKICTDIKQSKKLIKIGLDPKTADMFWRDWRRKTELITIPCVGWGNEKEDLPCWSLSALLDILKDKFTFGGASDKDWFVAYTINTPRELLTIYESNLVDACVAMVEKLHELNLL